MSYLKVLSYSLDWSENHEGKGKLLPFSILRLGVQNFDYHLPPSYLHRSVPRSKYISHSGEFLNVNFH